MFFIHFEIKNIFLFYFYLYCDLKYFGSFDYCRPTSRNVGSGLFYFHNSVKLSAHTHNIGMTQLVFTHYGYFLYIHLHKLNVTLFIIIHLNYRYKRAFY